MILTCPQKFLEHFKACKTSASTTTMREAMLVSPEHFKMSSQSAADNLYMDRRRIVNTSKALNQHQMLKIKIESLGVRVNSFPGLPDMDDAVFTNNTFATTYGRFIIGHMLHQVRKIETTRQDVKSFFSEQMKYETVDLSKIEGVAELTGALIIDHQRNIGFCGLSSRADIKGAKNMNEAFKLDATFVFDLAAAEYHTNVVFTILAGKAAILFPGGLNSEAAAAALSSAYGDGMVAITEREKNAFAANSLAITPRDVLFSTTAFSALTTETKSKLSTLSFNLHHVDVSEFEKAGGSLRCLIGEIF
jgi:N-dimethylarginine dimethylaminohydrolase